MPLSSPSSLSHLNFKTNVRIISLKKCVTKISYLRILNSPILAGVAQRRGRIATDLKCEFSNTTSQMLFAEERGLIDYCLVDVTINARWLSLAGLLFVGCVARSLGAVY